MPAQPWLDGINAGDGFIKQFVAMPLGMGYTVEGQVTGEERHGGLQLVCFDPKPGRFPDQPPRAGARRARRRDVFAGMIPPARPPRPAPRRWAWPPAAACASTSTPTRTASTRGIRTTTAACSCTSSTASSGREITGEPLPPTPVDAHTYTNAGLPVVRPLRRPPRRHRRLRRARQRQERRRAGGGGRGLVSEPALIGRDGPRYPLTEPRWRGDDGSPLLVEPLPGITRDDVDARRALAVALRGRAAAGAEAGQPRRGLHAAARRAHRRRRPGGQAGVVQPDRRASRTAARR